ncbi:MAG: hypothetical protein MR443_12875 [Lachnospiraceae bacterium]|nr:hypothetical protein [Lachnospiraceae bacterium]
MDEKGKLFRAMTWIDDHYVLEAETYGNVSMESRQHTQEQDTIRNLPANRKRGRVKCKGNKGLHAVSHRRKMLAAAAALAVCVLVLGTNANVQAAFHHIYMQVASVVWQKPVSAEVQDLDFSDLPDDVKLRTIEELSDQCRRYSFTDAEGQTIWLIQIAGEDQTESMLTAEGTIQKRTGQYGTYWEIHENDNNSMEWQQENGNRMTLSGDVKMQELKQIYRAIVQQ